jgi:hypothetical protein
MMIGGSRDTISQLSLLCCFGINISICSSHAELKTKETIVAVLQSTIMGF